MVTYVVHLKRNLSPTAFINILKKMCSDIEEKFVTGHKQKAEDAKVLSELNRVQ